MAGWMGNDLNPLTEYNKGKGRAPNPTPYFGIEANDTQHPTWYSRVSIFDNQDVDMFSPHNPMLPHGWAIPIPTRTDSGIDRM